MHSFRSIFKPIQDSCSTVNEINRAGVSVKVRQEMKISNLGENYIMARLSKMNFRIGHQISARNT